MEDNPHFSALLRSLSAHQVDFLVVGGYAVMKYTEPRYTKDLDIWIRSTMKNAERVYSALDGLRCELISFRKSLASRSRKLGHGENASEWPE